MFNSFRGGQLQKTTKGMLRNSGTKSELMWLVQQSIFELNPVPKKRLKNTMEKRASVNNV